MPKSSQEGSTHFNAWAYVMNVFNLVAAKHSDMLVNFKNKTGQFLSYEGNNDDINVIRDECVMIPFKKIS